MIHIFKFLVIAGAVLVSSNAAFAQSGFKVCGQKSNVNQAIQNCIETANGHQYKTLKDMTKLKKLDISKSRKGYNFGDVGAGYLGQASNLSSTLQTLQIRNDDLTDAGVKNFEHLQALENLSFYSSTAMTDAAFESLGKLKGLKKLTVQKNKNIDGSGLVHLVSLPNLETLNLSYSENITKENLQPLSQLKSLKVLKLEKTNITKDDVDFLLAVNPDMRIYTDY